MIVIDGAKGEGGGQILRTALTLSMVTGKPFTIENIRAGRAKPGLMRQHLACVKAAAEICGAGYEGADTGSQRLAFWPGKVRAGTYRFAIGTAGSCTLVLQTVMMALALADEAASVTVTGGTHNMMAPSFDFLDRTFLPLVRRMGFKIHAVCARRGFYPAGGGEIQLTVEPRGAMTPLELLEAGKRLRQEAKAVVANLPFAIAEREAETFRAAMNWPHESCLAREDAEAIGPGNVIVAALIHEHVTEVFTGFGKQGKTAERVARDLAGEVRDYVKAGAPVGPHLADQLLLPMALGAGGRFVTSHPTQHTHTNIDTIQRFLDVPVTLAEIGNGHWSVEVDRK